MKNTRFNVFSGAWVLVIMAVLVLGCGRFLGSNNGAVEGDLSRISGDLPMYDVNAPLQSPGAAVLRQLAHLEPDAAKLAPDVEAAERVALKAVFDKLRARNSPGNSTAFNASRATRFSSRAASFAHLPVLGAAAPALFFLQAAPAPSTNSDTSIITLILSGWSDLFTQSLTSKESGVGVKGSSTTPTTDGIKSTMSAELARGTDGTTTFGFELQTEGTKNGVAVKTDVVAKVDGQRCPTAEGQVSFTLKLRIGAEAGGASSTQELTAFVRAVVNDDAEVVNYTIDVIQATRRKKDGREIYVESGITFKGNGDDYENAEASNMRLIQNTDNVTRAEVGELTGAGHEAATAAAAISLGIAKNTWQGGGCTKIEAKSPGTVATSSATAIPVTVRHKYDGAEIPSKLEATLKGETSIDPTKLPRTPGTLTYTAPAEKLKSATISLTATSRRGRATLDLDANTGGKSYRVAGVSNGVSFTGEICSLSKNFDVEAKFPGGSAVTSFAPKNDARGITRVLGGGGGCEHTGDGTYTVTLNEDGSGTLTWTTSDKITCPYFGNSKTSTFTLPLQPAPEISCP